MLVRHSSPASHNSLKPGAYRTVRGATPGVYTEKFVEALVSHGYALGGEDRVALWSEAAEVARRAAETDVRLTKLLVDVLDTHQRGLSDIGRREEALETCREMARAGRRGYEAGAAPCPTFGSASLATRLAEEGAHAEAAALFGAIVHDERREAAGKDFWARIAWIAELDAAGEHPAARDALRALIDADREHAERHTGPFAFVVWESLLLASMEREQGREREAERCDRETEVLLAALAADGEPRTWSNILSWWAVLAGLTGRKHDRPADGEPEAPLFSSLGWSPDIRRRYLGAGRDALGTEVARACRACRACRARRP